MDRRKEWIWVILSLSAFLSDPGFGYSIIEGPRNATVLVGSAAQFSCTVSEGWKILIWLLNGHPKLSVLGTEETIQTDSRYTQTGHKVGTEFTSELRIDDVQLSDSGQITCSLQNDPSESAFLSVQESNYQKELRKVSEKKITDRNLETMRHSGNENYGYNPEEPRHIEEMAGVPASSPVNPGFYGPEQDLEVNPASEVPYDGQHDEFPSINPRNIRNVTIV